MEALVLSLLLLASVLLSSVIDQIVPKVSSPLIQIGIGVVIALVAQEQISVTLDPELFLVLFIAPLLFKEAKEANKAALWKNRNAMLSLAIGLVVVSTLVVGFVLNLLVPSIPLAAAFALGAALGPTDAVSVASLSKETEIPERQKSILAGESLINDASGIVSFQFAIAAAVTGTFSLFEAAGDFAVSFFGGIVAGAILGYLGNLIMRKVRDIGLENTTFHVLFEVFMPFIVYLAAEPFHASGIIAVVVAGLINSLSTTTMAPSVSRMNIVSTSVWRVISFALNGIVFVLLGTQLPRAMETTWEDLSFSNDFLLLLVVIITALVLGVRFIWCLGMEAVHHHYENKAAHEAGNFENTRPFGVQDVKAALITTLAGPKGTITLAVMFSMPLYASVEPPFVPFPSRDLLIFLACGVIVFTLLLATFVVPVIAPRKERKPVIDVKAEAKTQIEILRNVIEELTARQQPETRFATRYVVRSYNERIQDIKNRLDLGDDEGYQTLRHEALTWEQEYVQEAIRTGEVSADAGYQYLNRLNHREKLLRHGGSVWTPQGILLRLRTVFHAVTFAIFFTLSRAFSDVAEVRLLEHSNEVRELQIASGEHVIAHLRKIVLNSNEVATEDASSLLLEYLRNVASLRANRPAIGAITRNVAGTDEIRRLGLQLELEQIQSMYEEERLSRATAKRLRDSVHLMQMDLENNI